MAQFTRPVITQAGQALMTRVLADETTINFTRITTSSASYTPGQLETLTSLADIKQEILVAGTTIIDGTQVKITGAMNNRDLTVEYQHSTTGFWAQDGSGNEILYGVSIVDLSIAGNTPMFIPPFSGGSTGLIFNVLLQIGNAEQVILEPSPAALATARQVYDIKNRQVEQSMLTTENFITATSTAMLDLPADPRIEDICVALWQKNPRFNAFELNPPVGGIPTNINSQTPGDTHKRIRIEMFMRSASEGRFLIRLWTNTSSQMNVASWERNYRILEMDTTTPNIPVIEATDVNWISSNIRNAWETLDLNRDTTTLADALIAIRGLPVGHGDKWVFSINSEEESERMRVPVSSLFGALKIERIRPGSWTFLLTYIPAANNHNLNNNFHVPIWIANFPSTPPTDANTNLRWRRLETASTARSLADIGLSDTATLEQINTAMRAPQNRHFEILSIGVSTVTSGLLPRLPQTESAMGHLTIQRVCQLTNRFMMTYYANLNINGTVRMFIWNLPDSGELPTENHWEEISIVGHVHGTEDIEGLAQYIINVVGNTGPSMHTHNLATDVTGRLPLANMATSEAANRVLRVGAANTNPTYAQVNLGTDVTGTLPSGNIGSHNHNATNINAGRLALARHATSGTANRVLRVGTANTDPVYGQVALGTDVSGRLPLANTATSGTANRVLRVGTANSNPVWGQVNLGTDVTGTLPSGNIGVHTNATGMNIGQASGSVFGHAMASTANPLMDGAVSIGTDNGLYARGDHRHPIDTSRAPLNSPAFTGTPVAPAPPSDDSSTRLVTTNWVQSVLIRGMDIANNINLNNVLTPGDYFRPSLSGSGITNLPPNILTNSAIRMEVRISNEFTRNVSQWLCAFPFVAGNVPTILVSAQVWVRHQARISENPVWSPWHEVLLGGRVEDITLTPTFNITSGHIRVQRQAGARMTTLYGWIAFHTATLTVGTPFAVLPAGFRPTFTVGTTAVVNPLQPSTPVGLDVTTAGNIQLTQTVSANGLRFNITYLANL